MPKNVAMSVVLKPSSLTRTSLDACQDPLRDVRERLPANQRMLRLRRRQAGDRLGGEPRVCLGHLARPGDALAVNHHALRRADVAVRLELAQDHGHQRRVLLGRKEHGRGCDAALYVVERRLAQLAAAPCEVQDVIHVLRGGSRRAASASAAT